MNTVAIVRISHRIESPSRVAMNNPRATCTSWFDYLLVFTMLGKSIIATVATNISRCLQFMNM